MSKENPLSHHEQLRYDYLFKNIHYLNEREKKEFAYLQGKLNMASGSEVSPEIHNENHLYLSRFICVFLVDEYKMP